MTGGSRWIRPSVGEAIGRSVSARAVADPAVVADPRRGELDRAANPVFIAGPDIDVSGAWDTAVALAEQQRLPVWASPATGGSRLGFPEGHPNFRGVLPPAIGPLGQTLEGHDLILVAGSSVFPYYPHIPGPLLAEGSSLVAITSDPDEAARAPMGDAADRRCRSSPWLPCWRRSRSPRARSRSPIRVPGRFRSAIRSTPRRRSRRLPRSSPRTASSSSSRPPARWRCATR